LFAVQAALIELWRSWESFRDGAGHSVGEFAAAYCSGVYSLETALLLITERARLMQSLPAGSAMASIFTDDSIVAAVIDNARPSSFQLRRSTHQATSSFPVRATRSLMW
jgi:acyl transferase domain-containing protein